MLFVHDDPTFTLLLKVQFPSTDPKKPHEGTFTARYKDFDADDLAALSKEISGMKDKDAMDFILDEGDAIGQIGDKQGTLLSWQAQREYVYRRLPLRKAVINGFMDSVGGVQKGNSLLSQGR